MCTATTRSPFLAAWLSAHCMTPFRRRPCAAPPVRTGRRHPRAPQPWRPPRSITTPPRASALAKQLENSNQLDAAALAHARYALSRPVALATGSLNHWPRWPSTDTAQPMSDPEPRCSNRKVPGRRRARGDEGRVARKASSVTPSPAASSPTLWLNSFNTDGKGGEPRRKKQAQATRGGNYLLLDH